MQFIIIFAVLIAGTNVHGQPVNTVVRVDGGVADATGVTGATGATGSTGATVGAAPPNTTAGANGDTFKTYIKDSKDFLRYRRP